MGLKDVMAQNTKILAYFFVDKSVFNDIYLIKIIILLLVTKSYKLVCKQKIKIIYIHIYSP